MAYIILDRENEGQGSMRSQMRTHMRGSNMHGMGTETSEAYRQGYKQGYKEGWEDKEKEKEGMMEQEKEEFRRVRRSNGQYM